MPDVLGTARANRHYKKWVAPVVIGVILAGTLTPYFGPGEPASGLCLICGSRGLADAIVNVLLFLPLGVALGWSLARPSGAVAAAALLSGAIEGLQFMIPGRYPVIGDVVFNTLGALLGVLLAGQATVLIRPGPRARRWLCAAAAAVPVVTMLLTAWLLQPSFPQSAYYGQWTADLGHLEAYEGRILEASIGGTPAPSHRLADSDTVRARLLGGAPVRVVFRSGARPPALAPIFSVFDDHQREIVLYGLDDRDLVLRYRSRAVAMRLDQPDLRIPDGAPGLPAPVSTPEGVGSGSQADRDTRTVTMVAQLRSDGFCVWLTDRERACPVAHSAGRGWAFLLYPESLARRFTDGIDFAWILLLTLPIGFWGRRVRPSAALAAPALAASVLVPLLFEQVGFSAWVAAAPISGALLGLLLSKSSNGQSAAGRVG